MSENRKNVFSEEFILNEDTGQYVPLMRVDSDHLYGWDTQLWREMEIPIQGGYAQKHLRHLVNWRRSDLIPMLRYDENGVNVLVAYLKKIQEWAWERFDDLVGTLGDNDENIALARETGQYDQIEKYSMMNRLTAEDIVMREIVLSMDGANPADSEWAEIDDWDDDDLPS